jgi:hypothetical protein
MTCRDQSPQRPGRFQHAEDSASSIANSTKQVNAEANMKTILSAIIALLVLTGVAGSAAMIRSTDAS